MLPVCLSYVSPYSTEVSTTPNHQRQTLERVFTLAAHVLVGLTTEKKSNLDLSISELTLKILLCHDVLKEN